MTTSDAVELQITNSVAGDSQDQDQKEQNNVNLLKSEARSTSVVAPEETLFQPETNLNPNNNITNNNNITLTQPQAIVQQHSDPDFVVEVDTEKLFTVLRRTQCPLMPKKFSADDIPRACWWYNNQMWVCDDNDSSRCKPMNYADDDDHRRYEKNKDKVEIMFGIDDYLSDVRINTSLEIYEKLVTARMEARGLDDGNDDNDAYKQLIPSQSARYLFLTVALTVTLNGFFILYNIYNQYNGDIDYGSTFLEIIALLTAISELVLYANVLFGEVGNAIVELCYRYSRGDTTHKQTKKIAIQLRSLSTLSILRYLPSVELMANYITHFGETSARVWVEFFLLYKKFRNLCDVIFTVPMYIVESIAPFLAFFAILIKLKQLNFINDGDQGIFYSWTFTEYLTFLAFLNQVAGLRVIRNIETTSIQHFVFSGSDAKLDREELLLLADWWDTTLLSSVSNIGLSMYDSLVFWYSLDPLKIQLLLKNHDQSDKDGKSLMEKIRANDQILDDYTAKVNAILQQEQQAENNLL